MVIPARVSDLVQTEFPTNIWVNGTWAEFVAIADAPENAKATCYYFKPQMRIETMGVGPDHAVENGLIYAAIIFFCTLRSIPCRGLVNASYRRTGYQEAQPDASFYFQDAAAAVPQGNTIIDLDTYEAPALAIEVAATSLNDDLGVKRLLYEALGVREYWVIDVENSRILAFQILDRGSQRISQSLLLPGLEIEVLERALVDRQTQDDSQIMAGLMQRFQV
jgi:Uma2 family endonuclease